MNIRIALAGNPNSGKTTLFNALTGSNQFVGNWPGVTVEKKEGKLKGYNDVIITDLPGIYSLSPYTLEEVVTRKYLLEERTDVILNIVDGTNLERNLYLTTQLVEIGIPVVMAINMMDVVEKRGDVINTTEMEKKFGCTIVEISALKGKSLDVAAKAAIDAAKKGRTVPRLFFQKRVEQAISFIEETAVYSKPKEQQRFYAIKIFEKDEKVLKEFNVSEETRDNIRKKIEEIEIEMDDDSESIITNERYTYISYVVKTCYKKKKEGGLSLSDKIDGVVTNRFMGLPIFAGIMFMVYYISMVTIGAFATDWANDGLFGEGYHLFGNGTAQYEEAAEAYGDSDLIIEAFANAYGTDEIVEALDSDSETYDEENAKTALAMLVDGISDDAMAEYEIEDEETLEIREKITADKGDLINAQKEFLSTEYKPYIGAPDTKDYGIWVMGVPALIEKGLDAIHTADWLKGLILDGIVAGVGAVLGFVPQMLVLFFLLAFLESCGYMARIAFVLDRIFRKFGLSGKSFIPMLVGMGCGVPGIMASRTIENESDRRMTILTTTFIPCGAKVPFIAMIAGAIFGGSPLVSTSAYFIGMAAIVVSGIILKKTRRFAGETAPFVMEMPAYHMPSLKNIFQATWERGWSFIKKAGTIILISTIVVWFLSFFGWKDGGFGMLTEDELNLSILARIGSAVSWLFIPLGWGNWQAAVATFTGLVAKENIVGTMGVLYGVNENVYENLGQVFNGISGYSFLVFNLLCAPCFAAIGAIKREMNSRRWTFFAVGYQCGFAYVVAFLINQIGNMVNGKGNVVGMIFAFSIIIGMIYLLFRPNKIYQKEQKRCIG